MATSRQKKLPANLESATGVEEALALLKSLANPERLAILCGLIEGEQSVSEIESSLGIRQPTLSQQLARLRLDALVETRREGKVVYYRIASDQAERVIALLYEMYCGK